MAPTSDDAQRPPIGTVADRVVAARELATIRAALRLWIETPPDFIPEQSYVDAGDPPLEGADVEQLLGVLLQASALVIR